MNQVARAWCKVSATLDHHPKIRKAGNLGRQVFEYSLRVNAQLDRGGLIPASYMDHDHLASELMFSPQDGEDGLAACVKVGLLCSMSGQCPDMSGQDRDCPDMSHASDGANYLIVGWSVEWSKGVLTEAERKRSQRARSRNQLVAAECPDTVRTEMDTSGHVPNVPIRREEKRREERREEIPEREIRASRAIQPTPVHVPTGPSGWAARQSWWVAMLEADLRIKAAGIEPSAPSLPKTCAGEHEKNVNACATQLAELGYSPDEVDAKMRHIVLVSEAIAIHREKSRRYFKPSIIWDPPHALRDADTSIAEARKPPRAKGDPIPSTPTPRRKPDPPLIAIPADEREDVAAMAAELRDRLIGRSSVAK